MKVSLFIELSVPKPWGETTERDHINNTLTALEFADKVGFHAVWVTEHHFLEEYSHASSPEIFLAAASQRTKNTRLGFGIMHTLPQINHPLRVAERVSTLDQISGGRVDLGTGESSTVGELDGYRADPGTKRAAWREGLRTSVRAMTETPFTGVHGEFVQAPARNVVPKPYQDPHPPLWVACTRNSTVTLAGELGIGALSFSMHGAEQWGELQKHYYETLERAVPLGETVTADTAAFFGDLVLGDSDEDAAKRAGTSEGWLGYCLEYYYVSGQHVPGRGDLWGRFQDWKRADAEEKAAALAREVSDGPTRDDWRERSGDALLPKGVGSLETIYGRIKEFEDVGSDQILFCLPPTDLEINMGTLERLGKVIGEFHERDEVHVKERAKRMEPVIERAMARRVNDAPPFDPDYTFGGTPVSWDGKTRADEVLQSVGLAEQT